MDFLNASKNAISIIPVEIMFPIAFGAFILAAICMSFVKKGHGDKAHLPKNLLETLDIDD